ncbi:MAG: hypothetical protein BJ554DRAFT_5591 [Olpidium bornovanus]|uniref:Derlin n=1 Tax=Olpidium bornovanus TaxID=278681 RepID=A0A8H8DKX1_9FUNG|nr:MAG: hypothetical protein BJ554DRAFT_5591 [Olpidium bornovanus]
MAIWSNQKGGVGRRTPASPVCVQKKFPAVSGRSISSGLRCPFPGSAFSFISRRRFAEDPNRRNEPTAAAGARSAKRARSVVQVPLGGDAVLVLRNSAIHRGRHPYQSVPVHHAVGPCPVGTAASAALRSTIFRDEGRAWGPIPLSPPLVASSCQSSNPVRPRGQQIWRLLTCFFLHSPNLNFLFDLAFFYRCSKDLEERSFFGRTADYGWFVTAVMGMLLVGAGVGIATLRELSLLMPWSARNAGAVVGLQLQLFRSGTSVDHGGRLPVGPAERRHDGVLHVRGAVQGAVPEYSRVAAHGLARVHLWSHILGLSPCRFT